jgi:RNA polymerase sigma-70 factor (ECF subfamily)
VTEDFNDPARLDWEKAQCSGALAGDRTAFAALYRAYAQPLYSRVLLPKLGNVAAAQDALSETFRTAFEKLGGFEPRGASIYFWLARIANNKALDMHRARATGGRALVNIEAHFYGMVEQMPAPDAQLAMREHYCRSRERLAECLTALNPRYRRAIELRFFEERERDACALELGVSTPTFDVLMLRALRSLHKHWDHLAQDAKEPISERY